MTCPTYVLYTPVLRSSHLERLAPLPGFRVLAASQHPDCDERLLAASPVPVLLAGEDVLEADLLADPPDVLEVTEPLWRAEWPRSLRLAQAAPDALLVTYAIEVLPPPAGLAPDPGRLAAVAFGSSAASAAYASCYPDATWRSTVLPERRPRCPDCFPDGAGEVPAAAELVFAAEFSERKAVDLLMAAWDRAAPPSWRLRLLGWGPRTAQVQDWARGRADVEVQVAADRGQVHDALRRAAAVVLPSRRVEGWREQVGLSLVEGQAHGCRLLTTTESGLAEDLAAAGAVVVAPGDAAALADGLARLGPPPGRKRLPGDEEDSRRQVQAWLCAQAGVRR